VLFREDSAMTPEGASSSFFILTADDVVVTRPVSNALLAGCTRKAVLALTKDGGLKIDERAITLEEAYRAKEAFLTSASNFLIPVIRIDDREIGTGSVGPIARLMREHYIRFAKTS
jgi:D-alanine transaminase